MITLIYTLVTILILTEPPKEPLTELLPGLFISEGIVEFEGTIAIDCHHPDTPDVYLEMFVTAPDSREHESLVVASLKPFALHAALLAAGFEPGLPLTRHIESNEPIPAKGDRLSILIQALPVIDDDSINDQQPSPLIPIENWVTSDQRNLSLSDSSQWGGFVFAGSTLIGSTYTADQSGTLISLTSFGDEVIAPTWTVSHLAEIDQPIWIANNNLLPKQGTKVRIRVEKQPVPVTDVHPGKDSEQTKSHQPDGININRDR